MTFLKAHDAQKNSHFRTWKSGKNWLYAASALTILTGLSMGGTLFASASTVQINYTQPATNSGQAVYAYVWGTGSSADGNFTALTNIAGTSNYTFTLPEGNTGGDVGIILINKGDWSGTKLISTSNQQFENNAFTAGKSLIVNVDATGNPTETDFNEPTITAPTSLKATVNSPINLSATVFNPDQLATKRGFKSLSMGR